MRTEQRLAAAFAESLDPARAADFADRITYWCLELLTVDAASVSIASPEGGMALASVTSAAAAEIERAELDWGVGPCAQALATAVPVHVDLDDADRWPGLAALAGAAGYRSMYASPMRHAGDTVGVLHLFFHSPGPPAPGELAIADGIAEVAAARLVRQRTAESLDTVAAQLRTALTSRVPIEQAKGVLAERLGIPVSGAFTVMRSYARRNNLRLDLVARTVAARGVELATMDWADELRRLKRR